MFRLGYQSRMDISGVCGAGPLVSVHRMLGPCQCSDAHVRHGISGLTHAVVGFSYDGGRR